MSKQYEINIYFPWKRNNGELHSEKILVDDFYGIDIIGQLMPINQRLGIKITAKSNKKFSVDLSIDVKISKRSNKKKYTSSDNFLFDNSNSNAIIFPEISLSEVENYLISKDGTDYIKIYFFILLNLQSGNPKNEKSAKSEKSDKSSKNPVKTAKKKNESYDYSEDEENVQYNKNKQKETPESKPNDGQKNKPAKKAKSQNSITTRKNDDYYDEEEVSNKNHSQRKSTKENCTQSKRKNDDEYDDEEVSNKNHSQRKSTKENRTQSKRKNDDYYDEEEVSNKNHSHRKSTKENHVQSKRKNDDDDYSEDQKQLKKQPKRISKSQVQLSTNHRKFNDYDYESEEKPNKYQKIDDKKKSHHLIRQKNDDYSDEEPKRAKSISNKKTQDLIKQKHNDYSDDEPKQIKKPIKKNDDEIEKNPKKKQQVSTHHSSKKTNYDDYESNEYESADKHNLKQRKTSKNQVQSDKNKDDYYDYKSDEKSKETTRHKRKESRSKSQVLYNNKDDEKEEKNSKIPKRKTQIPEKEEDNEPVTRKTSKLTNKNEEEKTNSKTLKEEEAAPKNRRTSKAANKNEEEKISNLTKEEENTPKKRRAPKLANKDEEENVAKATNGKTKNEENTPKNNRTSKASNISKEKKSEKKDEEKGEKEETLSSEKGKKSTTKKKKEIKDPSTPKEDNEKIENVKKTNQANNEVETNKKLDKAKSGNQKEDNHVLTEETCPFIGLSNLGATCYMNSAIQVLFHTALFRKNVLTYDTGITNINEITSQDASNKSKRILFNLQYLFYQMIECMKQQSNHEFHNDYISTAPLTKSFGWSNQDTSLQQDVHEFIINFFEVLDTCTKNPTQVNQSNIDNSMDNGSITGLFKGRIITSITNKKDGKLILHSFENFYDFSLLVKGNNSIYQSLNAFTEKDELKGNSNNQELIQVQFYSLPKVLHIHLRRFVYSHEHCRTDKVNDYFSFPDNLDMKPYVFNGDPKESKKSTIIKKKKRTEDENNEEICPYKGECKYSLYGVIVHQGKMSYIGHYYAYLKLDPGFNNENRDYNINNDNWYLFNDTKVSKVTKEEAINLNFGEKEGQQNNVSSDDSDFHCAYILLYVRNDAINEVFNIRNSEIKIPPNVINCINSKNNNNSCNLSLNDFNNFSTNSTIGFTLITEDCVRMNCKRGKSGIDNRLLSKRINVPFDQIFTLKNDNDRFSAGGLYAAVSIFLKVDLFRLRLWTITSSYEIGEQLNRFDFEITKEMQPKEIEEIKEKAISIISPRVIFVEIIPLESYENNGNEDTEETEESSSVIKHYIPIVTKLYTRETQCPMLYTGILSNLSYSHSINSIIKHHYKKQLLELTCLSKTKVDEKFCKEMIDSLVFDVFYEKKKSNYKDDTNLYKLNLSKSLKGNNVPKGSFLIFSINPKTTSNNNQSIAEEIIIRWINDLINYDKSIHSNIYSINDNNSTVTVNRYCNMMVTECPVSPIDFCNLFTNTEIYDVYRYKDNKFFGKVELPTRLSFNQLSNFIAFQFDIKYNNSESKMLFFSDGPALRPIEADSNSTSSIFQLNENFRKSFFFEIVPKDFQYSDACFTLSVSFSADSISLTQKFNFFVETYSTDEDDNNETKNKQTSDINAVSFDYILKNVLKLSENSKNVSLNDLRCFWMSKETGQIVSDFILIDSKKKKNYISEKDILILNRELRVEIIPKEQKNEMKSISKAILKSKIDEYCGYRLEVYKSYVQDNYDGYNENGNNNSHPLLKIFDFPFVLVNVDPNSKVKKLKEQISSILSSGKNQEKNDYLSIKYASLFIPPLEKNLYNKQASDDDDDYEEDDVQNKAVSWIKDDYSFAFDATSILKNDDKICLVKNQPNKLFLVYSQDRALGKTNDGVVFY